MVVLLAPCWWSMVASRYSGLKIRAGVGLRTYGTVKKAQGYLGLRILRLIPKFCSLVVRGRLRQGACRFLVAANARSIVRLA